ncbi:MAG: RNA polymerase sigma factor [Acidobacteriota bacterium]
MPSLRSDEELIEAWKSGKSAAFDELVERHMKRIYNLGYRLTGTHDDADDLAQETFIRAYRGLSRFRGESRFSTWLTRITLNLSRNPRRRHLSLSQQVEEPVESAPGALDRVVTREKRQRVRQAVAGLPLKQRQTLLLRLFEGLRYREIAAVLGTTTGTAKANFFHAVKGVARQLAEGDAS